MRLTNLIRRDVFMTSGELAIPGGVFMAGGGPGGVVGGVRSAYGLLTRPNFGRVLSFLRSDPPPRSSLEMVWVLHFQ